MWRCLNMEYVEFTDAEIKWTKSLQRLLNKQPETLTAYCTGTSVNFYQSKELPTIKGHEGQVNGSIECISVKNKNWDAGAY